MKAFDRVKKEPTEKKIEKSSPKKIKTEPKLSGKKPNSKVANFFGQPKSSSAKKKEKPTKKEPEEVIKENVPSENEEHMDVDQGLIY